MDINKLNHSIPLLLLLANPSLCGNTRTVNIDEILDQDPETLFESESNALKDVLHDIQPHIGGTHTPIGSSHTKSHSKSNSGLHSKSHDKTTPHQKTVCW